MLPGLLSDVYFHKTNGKQVSINRKIVVTNKEPVSLITKNIDQIEYRAYPLSTFGIVIDFLVHGLFIELPGTAKQSAEKHLLNKGALVRKDNSAQTKIVVDARDNGYTIEVNASVWSGGEETAHYRNRFRKAYYLENHGDLLRYKEKYGVGESLKKSFLALLQDTFWTKILARCFRFYHSPSLSEFIDQSIEVRVPIVEEETLIATVDKTDKIEEDYHEKGYDDYSNEPVRSCMCGQGTEVKMLFPYDNHLSFLSESGKREVFFRRAFPKIKETSDWYHYYVLRIICLDDEVVVVGMVGRHGKGPFYCPTCGTKKRSGDDYVFSLTRYSPAGDLLNSYILDMPKIEWQPEVFRPPVIDFVKLSNSYAFTLLDRNRKGQVDTRYRVSVKMDKKTKR